VYAQGVRISTLYYARPEQAKAIKKLAAAQHISNTGLLRLPPGNGVTVGTGFTVRNVAVARAFAITPLRSLV
jgi:hypothetical protein